MFNFNILLDERILTIPLSSICEHELPSSSTIVFCNISVFNGSSIKVLYIIEHNHYQSL